MALPTSSGSGDKDRQSGLPPAGRPNPPSGASPQSGLPSPPPRTRPLPPPPPAAPPRREEPRREAPQQQSYYASDDVFEPVPADELDDDTSDDSIIYAQAPVPEPTPPAPQRPAEDNLSSVIDQAPPSRRPQVEEEEDEESTFINPKQKKLVPFGGSKSKAKKSAKNTSALDARENRKAKARMVQIGVLALLVGLVGFGGYNALNPPTGVSQDDVATMIAANTASETFPFERGEAFATDFMTAYLTVDATERDQGDPLLSYYYTGVMGDGGAASTLALEGNFGQRILTQPRVFDRTPLTDYSAAFVVGALVEPYRLNAPPTTDADQAVANSTAKWVFYNVNVYYNEKRDTMAVTADSPSLVPPRQVSASADIPEEKLPGDGTASDDLANQVQSVVFGYIQAFAASSPQDYATLEQYLISKPGADLTRGLAGEYVLAGEPDTAIQYQAYADEADPGAVKVDVTVLWKDASLGEDSATYKSRYFLNLVKSADNKFLVSQFAPKYYSSASTS